MFIYLEYERYNANKYGEDTFSTFSFEEKFFVLRNKLVHKGYNTDNIKSFNDNILIRSHKEIVEKTDCRFKWEWIKKEGTDYIIFTVDNLPTHFPNYSTSKKKRKKIVVHNPDFIPKNHFNRIELPPEDFDTLF